METILSYNSQNSPSNSNKINSLSPFLASNHPLLHSQFLQHYQQQLAPSIVTNNNRNQLTTADLEKECSNPSSQLIHQGKFMDFFKCMSNPSPSSSSSSSSTNINTTASTIPTTNGLTIVPSSMTSTENGPTTFTSNFVSLLQPTTSVAALNSFLSDDVNGGFYNSMSTASLVGRLASK
jgi:hypothetical protein